MKNAYVLGAVLTVQALSGCNKPSDRYQGIEQQPSHPAERNPGTQPTTTPTGPTGKDAPALENPGTAPAEDPDSPGTTRTPATADSKLTGGGTVTNNPSTLPDGGGKRTDRPGPY